METLINVTLFIFVLANAKHTDSSSICGHSLIDSETLWRIVGGSDAATGEFPWQAIITLADDTKNILDKNFCGGSIINEEWVLTAGHCVDGESNITLKVRFGVHNMSLEETDEAIAYVEKVRFNLGQFEIKLAFPPRSLDIMNSRFTTTRSSMTSL